MNIRVVFFDIDGTLVSFHTHRIPESTLSAVKVLREKGIKVYIATGRPSLFIDNLGDMAFDGMVTVTGAHCLSADGTVIAHTPVPQADIERIIAYQQMNSDAYPVLFVCTDEAFITSVNDDVRSVLSQLNVAVPPVLPAEMACEKSVLQLISFFRPEDEERYMRTLMPGCTSTRWHPLFTDVVAAGVSKSAGIDSVLCYEGIALDEAMAFGDGGNDVSMLSHVGVGVAMGNASPQVQAAACYVTDTVDNDGVAKALHHFGLLD